MLAYSSPWHFGVRPVLRRLLAPRHPPCALPNFTVFASDPLRTTLSVVLVSLCQSTPQVSLLCLVFFQRLFPIQLPRYMSLLWAHMSLGSLKTKHTRRGHIFLRTAVSFVAPLPYVPESTRSPCRSAFLALLEICICFTRRPVSGAP
jgi:hypothetical protein